MAAILVQSIIRNYTGLLLIGPLGTNFIEILIKTQQFPLKKINLKMAAILIHLKLLMDHCDYLVVKELKNCDVGKLVDAK